MFNIRKNYQKNTLIIPNENYFIERAEKSLDEKVQNWTIVVCAAADQFFESLFFEIKDENNLFYTQRNRLDRVAVQQLFKTLAGFYLYLYCKEKMCDDNFRNNVYRIFEIAESEVAHLSNYKIMDEQRDELDYSTLPNNVKDYLEASKVSVTTMMHFYGLLLEKGFNEDIGKRPGDLQLLVKVAEIAILYFDNLVMKNV